MNGQDPHQPSGPESFRITWAMLAILITLWGQILLYTTPIDDLQNVLPSAVWVSLAGVFLFVLARWLPPNAFFQRLIDRLAFNSSAVWVLCAAIFSGLTALASYLFSKAGLNNFVPVVFLWFLSVFCYLFAFFPTRLQDRDWKSWLLERRGEILSVGLVMLLGIGLRFHNLGRYPFVINGDEGRTGMFAQATSDGVLANPFALWENFGALYLQAINFALKAFGPSPFSLRLLPAIGGSLAVLTVYLFAKQVAGRRIALITAILLATSHAHIHFSRAVAVAYIQGSWLVPLELYFLLSGLERRSSFRAALAGIILAFHLSVYLSAQMVAGMILVFMLIALFWLKLEFRPAWPQMRTFWASFGILALPESVFMLTHQDEWLNRINENGTFSSGWLTLSIALTGKSAPQLLLERVIHAFLSLIYYPAIDFYGSTIPMISFVLAVLFLLGLGYVLMRARSLKFLLLNGYFWGVTVAIGLFSIPPSADSYRMLLALPAAFLIAAIGLDRILKTLGLGWETQRFTYLTITTGLLTGLMFLNIWTYFFNFVDQCRYGEDPQTRFASYLGTQVAKIENGSSIYLLSDDIFQYGTHASTDFLTQSRPIINVFEPVSNQNFISGETIFASPPRIDELRAWTRSHPGGKLQYQIDCREVILLSYQLP